MSRPLRLSHTLRPSPQFCPAPTTPAPAPARRLPRTPFPHHTPLPAGRRFSEQAWNYLGIRFMLVGADSGEVAGVNPLETGRDVDLELEAVKPGKYWLLVESDWDGGPRMEAERDGVRAPPRAAPARRACVRRA